MKKLFIMSLVLLTSVASATEVTLLDTKVGTYLSFRSTAEARFHMDFETKEGFAKITVIDYRDVWMDHGPHYPYPHRPYPHYRNRMPVPVTVYSETVAVPGLMLMGDQVIYHGPEGDVVCGKMGESRILRKPTLFLSGKCQMKANLRNNNLTVKFITK